MSLEPLKAKLAVLLPAILAALLLAGCEGGSEPAFVDRPVASFLSGDSLTLGPSETTAAAVTLDRLARTDTWVRLFSVEEGQPGSFVVPATVLIPAQQKSTVFGITRQGHREGTVTIRILPDPAYNVGVPSVITVSNRASVDTGGNGGEVAAASTLLRLVGPDLTVQSGEGFLYTVQRNQCREEVTVPLAVTGDFDCFEVPGSVTLPSGSCAQTFSSVAGQCPIGAIEISILPPLRYALDTEVGTIVLQSGTSGLGENGTARVTMQP